MNKLTLGFGLAVVTVASLSASAFAAGANVTSGSVGQRANDPSTFGFAACNDGDATQVASLPVLVTANGVSISSQSSPSIDPGACVYTYVPYDSFNMIGGQTYTVQVSVNGADAQSYSLTVPGDVLGASTENIDRASLLATEIQLLQQLISLLESKIRLGL